MRKLVALSALALSLSLTACSSETAAPVADPSRTPEPGTPVLTAQQVVDAFTAAGLPAANPHDTTKDCFEDGVRWCEEIVTTTDVRVYRFATEAEARDMSEGWGGERVGVFHLSFLAARTPESLKPEYAKVATELVDGPAAFEG